MYYGPISMYHIGMQQQYSFPNANMFNNPLSGLPPERSMFTDPNNRPSIFTNPMIGNGLHSERSMFDEPTNRIAS